MIYSREHFDAEQRINRIVANIRFQNFVCEVSVDSSIGRPDPTVSVRLKVRDRDTGRPMPLAYVQCFHIEELKRVADEYIVRRIRNMVIEAMIHEVDECLLFKGKRIFDPHEIRLPAPDSAPSANSRTSAPPNPCPETSPR